MTIVVLGVITAVIVAMKRYVDFGSSDEVRSAVALVLNALVPVFVAWDAFLTIASCAFETER